MEEKRSEDQTSDLGIKEDRTKPKTRKKTPKSKSPYERKIPTKLLQDSRFFSWMDKSPKNENKALCKVCNCEIAGGVTQFERHGKTEKHLKNFNFQKQTSEVIDYYMEIETESTDVDLLNLQTKEEKDNELKQQQQKFFSEISKSKYPLVIEPKLSDDILQKYLKKENYEKESFSQENSEIEKVGRNQKNIETPIEDFNNEVPLDDVNIIKKNSAQPLQSSDILPNKDSKMYKCKDCEFKCKWKANLSRHMLIHNDSKLFKCFNCNFSCKQKRYLKTHMLIHSNKMEFKCRECNYECKQKCQLKRHMLTHSNVMYFKCSECEYVCKLKAHLRAHMLTHTNIKLYSCSECDYKCNHTSHMKTHMLTHTNVKLFKCSECNYKCKRNGHLKSHMLKHTKVKLYKCCDCKFGCNQRSVLKSHMLKRHAQ